MRSAQVTVFAAVLLSWLLAAPVLAEPAKLPLVGVGVAVPLSGYLGGTVYVPVNLHPRLRIEPGIGLASTGQETTGTSTSMTANASLIGLGVGAFYLLHPDDDAVVYLGSRMGVLLHSDKSTYADGSTRDVASTDVIVTLAVGGEHFVGKHFSLGAEATIGRAWVGQPEVTETPANTYTSGSAVETSSTTATGGALMVRFYF